MWESKRFAKESLTLDDVLLSQHNLIFYRKDVRFKRTIIRQLN